MQLKKNNFNPARAADYKLNLETERKKIRNVKIQDPNADVTPMLTQFISNEITSISKNRPATLVSINLC